MKTKTIMILGVLALGSIGIWQTIRVEQPTRASVDHTDEASTEAESAREGYSFDDLLDAIEWVESKGVATAIGKNGEVGAYQIKDIYLDDYVRITEDDWFVDHPNDMRLEKWFSRKVTKAVTKHYAHATWPNLDINDPQFIETAARSHKCPPERTKESTKPYWEKVKARMQTK